MRVGEDVRIPDISVVSENARDDRGFLLDPPILCVEVISPEQRFSTLLQKCEAYHQFGVPYCWVIDPDRKISWEYHREGTLTQGNEFLTAGDIRISLNELFR
jgi:Uma2 family endonuclease